MGKLVILWTDALIYILLVVVVLFAWTARRREHLRAPWRRVASSKLAMASAVVLSVYVVIGLMDSVHFRPPLQGGAAGEELAYSGDTLSLLDVLVTPLRTRVERTYSAPFALRLYSKETVELPGGNIVREYPRLKYGGAQVQDRAERDRDIIRTSLLASGEAFLAWLALCLAVTAWLARRRCVGFAAMVRRLARGRTDVSPHEPGVPWRVLLITAGAMLLLVFLCAHLGVKYHLLGTDKVGQDVFYQSLKSIRTGLVIGTLTTLVMLPFAVLLGVTAGYFGGWVDDLIQYLYTTLNSIPGVLLIAAAILLLQVYMDSHAELFDTVAARADLRLLFLCIILGVTSWTTLCRLLRGEALKLREAEYVQAAVALGARHYRVLGRHVVPNVMHIVLITVVLDFSGLVLAEAVLSYVGVGVDPTMNSWGNMINRARLELARDPMVWWTLAAAFVFMLALVLSANLVADAVRDAFDPRGSHG
jgi:peptide/nickel transport system permease protein